MPTNVRKMRTRWVVVLQPPPGHSRAQEDCKWEMGGSREENARKDSSSEKSETNKRPKEVSRQSESHKR